MSNHRFIGCFHAEALASRESLAPIRLNFRLESTELISQGVSCVTELIGGYSEKMTENACPFCSLPRERLILSNALGVVIRDGFPVSVGHTLIIPRRHVSSYFDLLEDERDALLALLEEAKRGLEKEFRPQGYNIGINDGPAAGQTVPHLHIHLIPRYQGDQADPRGGVRWVIPDKADYWSHR